MDNAEQAAAIAADILGISEPEQPAEEPQATEVETEQGETQDQTVTETAEDGTVTATEETDESVKVPLKALQEEKRKRQEYEARLKELEAKVSESNKREPELQDIYDQDPQGTVSRINAEIARLQNDDPFENAETIERLRDLKVELKENSIRRRTDSVQTFMQTLQREVPELPQKVNDYTEFAIEQLGYDRQTLDRLTNPALVGPDAAIKFVKSVATQYNKAEAAKTATRKVVTPQPTKVEAPGTGDRPTTAPDLGRLKEEARSSRDWKNYLDAIGALD